MDAWQLDSKTMMDTNTAMATTLAKPKPIDTTKPLYYFPPSGNPDSCILQELTLYASRRLSEICFVHVKGESLEPPAVFEIHTSIIKIAKPPRFTGSKKNWEGFILAVNTYLMAYHEEFKNYEQKIWFIISYLGTEDSSQCVASDWLRNWKEENTYNHILHADDYRKFLEDLRAAFEDPNLKVNAANDLLWQLWHPNRVLHQVRAQGSHGRISPPWQHSHWSP